jgi:hypothetical protein
MKDLMSQKIKAPFKPNIADKDLSKYFDESAATDSFIPEESRKIIKENENAF